MKVPFFPNTGDGTHCWQAAIQMILGAFLPERKFAMDELVKISGKEEGKWTWPTRTLLWLNENGFETELVEDFDYGEFARDGQKYLLKRYGPQIANAQKDMGDLKDEEKLAKKFAPIAKIKKRPALKSDIINFLNGGYLIICNVNAAALYNVKGYSAHFIVITSADNNDVTFHDPGLPPKPDTKMSWADFEKGWAYPTARDKNLLAIKKSSDISRQ